MHVWLCLQEYGSESTHVQIYAYSKLAPTSVLNTTHFKKAYLTKRAIRNHSSTLNQHSSFTIIAACRIPTNVGQKVVCHAKCNLNDTV